MPTFGRGWRYSPLYHPSAKDLVGSDLEMVQTVRGPKVIEIIKCYLLLV